MHEVLVNRLGGLSLPRKSVVRLTDRPDMTLDVYRGRKNNNTIQKLYALFLYRNINHISLDVLYVSHCYCSKDMVDIATCGKWDSVLSNC